MALDTAKARSYVHPRGVLTWAAVLSSFFRTSTSSSATSAVCSSTDAVSRNDPSCDGRYYLFPFRRRNFDDLDMMNLDLFALAVGLLSRKSQLENTVRRTRGGLRDLQEIRTGETSAARHR